ncbi:MAG: 16S rRNA (cytosine(1402)-N(4))-methyltransferase RsmH [Microgenomates group bacterium]
MIEIQHYPVLLEEVLDAIPDVTGKVIIDATFGQGGHSDALLQKGATVLAFDWDIEAIQRGTTRFSKKIEEKKLYLVHASFDRLREIVSNHELTKDGQKEIDAILFDFGTSRDQLLSSKRGFSFAGDGPLDMRMDQRLGVTAADLLAISDEHQLAKILFHFGGEVHSKKIAKIIKQHKKPITSTSQLAAIISSIVSTRGKIHPATKTFQALRVAVNSELDAIEKALPQALEVVKPSGKILAISFHEGEDRLVKHAFRKWEEKSKGAAESKKPILATDEELKKNPPSRSAKLRIFIKK